MSEQMTGAAFGKWTVIEDLGGKVAVRCACGTEREVLRKNLLRGKSRSCGKCICRGRRTHGASGTAEYGIWRGIIKRTEDPKCEAFADYGGRGIRMCDRWRQSFEAFLADMGPRPTPSHSVERGDNARGYEPDNCRWATRTEQNRNTSQNVYLTLNGETLCVAEWASRLGVVPQRIHARLSLPGWTTERVLTQPFRKCKRNSERTAA